MNAQLKPTATNVLASSTSGSTSILNDLVSKMNAQTGGAMQDEQKAAFSKWLERHTTSTASADAVKQSAKAMPVQARSSQTTQPAVNREPKPMHAEHSHADAQAVAKQQANRKAEQTPNKNAQAKAGRKTRRMLRPKHPSPQTRRRWRNRMLTKWRSVPSWARGPRSFASCYPRQTCSEVILPA